jgi:hypothetical protein
MLRFANIALIRLTACGLRDFRAQLAARTNANYGGNKE